MSIYLVTGGAGFIGSHLCDLLLKEGHMVRVLDNFSTGKRENLREGVELFEADIRNAEAIKPAFVGVDGVFHLAAIPRVPYSVEFPVETSEINIMGTLNVLMTAKEAGVKRVVYSASSSAYGDQPVMPLTPTMFPVPKSPYAIQKYVGEHFMRVFAELYGMETVSLRYFNVYGPRMANEGAYVTVIAIFLRQHSAGEVLTIEGDGEQSRSFTHATDVARANLLAMASSRVGKGEVLNVGGPEEISVNKIASMIGGPTTHIAPRKGDVRRTMADISLTTQLLGWKPEVAFEEGMKGLLRTP